MKIINPVRWVLMAGIILLLSCPPAVSAGREVKLGTAEKRKLNTFFSNFSEVYLKPFSKGKLSDSALIHFGIWHRYINNARLFERVKNHSYDITNKKDTRAYSQRIKATHIDSAALWYFGRAIKKHQSSTDTLYQAGYYYFEGADGDALPFAQVTRLIDNGNGTLTAYTREYASHEADVHGTRAQWKKAGHEVTDVGRHKALIKSVGSGDRKRYVLLEYRKN